MVYSSKWNPLIECISPQIAALLHYNLWQCRYYCTQSQRSCIHRTVHNTRRWHQLLHSNCAVISPTLNSSMYTCHVTYINTASRFTESCYDTSHHNLTASFAFLKCKQPYYNSLIKIQGQILLIVTTDHKYCFLSDTYKHALCGFHFTKFLYSSMW